MSLEIEAAYEDSVRRQRFFVVHLSETDRPSPAQRYEFQKLNSSGQAASVAYATYHDSTIEIDGLLVPKPILDAAKRQPLGVGDYVDETVESLPPF